MSKPRRLLGPGPLLIMGISVCLCFAQDKPAPKGAGAQAPTALRVTITQIPSAMVNEWQDYQKNTLIPLMKKMGVTWSTAWRTATFGEAGEFIIARPIKDLAELDAPSPIINALGQEVASALSVGMAAKAQRFNASSRTFMATTRPDLSIPMASDYVPKLAVMVRTGVAPGRTDEYEKGSKELLAVLGKTNARGILVARVGLGGNPNEYITFVLFDSFADIGNFPAAYAKAAAEAKLVPIPAGVVIHTEWAAIRNVPELGIQPAKPNPAK